jgi:hypothetical protein
MQFIIEEYKRGAFDGEFSVWMSENDNASPKTNYKTKEKAAARILQLLGITETITPQKYPERIKIDEVSDEK